MRAHSFGARYGGAALVTGASAGIGEAFARRLAADGTDVVLVARRGDRLDALAAELTAAHGVRTEAIALDLVAADAIPRLLAALAERNIDVGLVVHNAGIAVHAPFATADPARLLAQVDLHCRVPVELTRALLPAMIARGRGGLVYVASVAGHLALASGSLYSATKAFDLFLGESLWGELAPLGIDALAVSPGYTRTEFHGVAGIDTSGIPAWAWTFPDDVAKAALGRLGKDASVVVGWRYQALTALIRLVPRGLLSRLVRGVFS